MTNVSTDREVAYLVATTRLAAAITTYLERSSP